MAGGSFPPGVPVLAHSLPVGGKAGGLACLEEEWEPILLHSTLHSLNRVLRSTCCALGSVLGIKASAMSKVEHGLTFCHFPSHGETGSKEIAYDSAVNALDGEKMKMSS